jgi:hypothetical protein
MLTPGVSRFMRRIQIVGCIRLLFAQSSFISNRIVTICCAPLPCKSVSSFVCILGAPILPHGAEKLCPTLRSPPVSLKLTVLSVGETVMVPVANLNPNTSLPCMCAVTNWNSSGGETCGATSLRNFATRFRAIPAKAPCGFHDPPSLDRLAVSVNVIDLA